MQLFDRRHRVPVDIRTSRCNLEAQSICYVFGSHKKIVPFCHDIPGSSESVRRQPRLQKPVVHFSDPSRLTMRVKAPNL